MNIGIDIRCLMERERSGVGQYTHELLDDLFRMTAEKKLANEFFLFYNSFHDVNADIPKWKYPFVHYCGFRFPNKVFNFCLKFLHWPKLDILMRRKLDYFIFPNQNFYALSADVKKIVVVHDLSFELYPECFSWRERLWHMIVNLRALARSAEHIIAVSENTKLDLLRLYRIDPKKIIVVYPHIRHQKLWEQNSTQARESGVLNKDDYILFLGTIEPRKNILGLLAAYERLCNDQRRTVPELWIAGKAGYRGRGVFAFWKTMRAKDHVKFLGYVDENQKRELYRGARLFIYPSLYEGFGMPLLEAMSVGVPVITSLTSSMHEVVGSAGILIDPNRVNDLAQAMKILLEDAKLREYFSARLSARLSVFGEQRAKIMPFFQKE